MLMIFNDLLFTEDDEELLEEFKRSMKKEFDMTDFDQMRFFLGMEVIQRLDGIFICPRKYVAEVLNLFVIENYNSVCNPILPGQKIGNGAKVDITLYKQIVGSLMYPLLLVLISCLL